MKFRLDKDSFLWLLLDPMKGCPVIEINHSQKLPEKFKLSNFSLLEEASVIRERKRCQYALPRSSWIKNTKFNYPCVPVLSSYCDQLKDILVKSCTLQKAKLTLTCIKFVAGRRTTASCLLQLPTTFHCIHRWFNAGVKSLLPCGSPLVAPAVEGADVLECQLSVSQVST